MKIQLVGSTNNLIQENGRIKNYLIGQFNKIAPKPLKINYSKIESVLEDSPDKKEIILGLKRFAQNFARKCYSKYDWQQLLQESFNETLIDKRILGSGHHSVFEHIWLNLDFLETPKIIAMVLNNQKQYATSEKSARYTIMENINPDQKIKYDWWMEKLIPEIEKVFPNIKEGKEAAVKKLAQENARYMTSVFTPTTFGYTVNLRQLNFMLGEIEKIDNGNSDLEERLNPQLKELASKLSTVRINGLENQTDRHLDFFREEPVEEYFGDVYATNYNLSFAGLAQAHRHRTISYEIFNGIDLGSENGFFIPEIVEKVGLSSQWRNDLEEISQYDFPQAQLLGISERGLIEDFRSKAILRICGHAQWEIMRNTLETAKKYTKFQQKYGQNAIKPPCLQKELGCDSQCNWKGKFARIRSV